MNAILRPLLLCLLLLALPFQAFASASMRLPAGPQAQPQPPCHQRMAQAAPDGERHDDKAQSHHEQGKCGSCAACCVGAAMASGLPASPALAPPSTAAIPFRAGYLPSVDPVLIERPPSLLRA